MKELRENVADSSQIQLLQAELESVVERNPALEVYRASPEALAGWARALEPNYDTLEGILRLPASERVSRLDASLVALRSGTNPLAERTLPFSTSSCRKEIQTEAMWAIFSLALDARLHGVAAADVCARIAALPDPFDGAPLTSYDVEGGVAVLFRDAAASTPVTFTVGLEPAK